MDLWTPAFTDHFLRLVKDEFPLLHSERMEKLQQETFAELKQFHEKSLQNQRELIETYENAQEDRNKLLRDMFDTVP